MEIELVTNVHMTAWVISHPRHLANIMQNHHSDCDSAV